MKPIDQLSDNHDTASRTLFEIKLLLGNIANAKKAIHQWSLRGVSVEDTQLENIKIWEEEIEKLKNQYFTQGTNNLKGIIKIIVE